MSNKIGGKMVKKMENEDGIKEIKISKFKMVGKFMRIFWYRIIKRKWYLPSVSEITVDQLYDLINANQSPFMIDTRDRREFNAAEGSYRKYGHISNAYCVPIMELSSNLEELYSYKEKEIITICPGGGMSLVAVEIMVAAGYINVKSLTGGMDLWHKKGYPTITAEDSDYPLEGINTEPLIDSAKMIQGSQPLDVKFMCEIHKTVDARNFSCPIPIVKSRKALKTLKINEVLEILATDPGSKADIPAWAHVTGQELISAEETTSKEFRYLVRRLK
jgi:tRNA 2-thiouridine synthesizing protein A